MLDRNHIVQLLQTNDRAVARALVALTERQTADEQAVKGTRYRNGQGFRPCHARMGTSMAQFFERNGYLTPNQLAYWREAQRDGRTRIEIYANQLLDIAREKAVRPRPQPQISQSDTDMEAELYRFQISEPEVSIEEIIHKMESFAPEIRALERA